MKRSRKVLLVSDGKINEVGKTVYLTFLPQY